MTINIKNVNKLFEYLFDNYPNAKNTLTISREAKVELNEVKHYLKEIPVIFSRVGETEYTIRKMKNGDINVAKEVDRVIIQKHQKEMIGKVELFTIAIAIFISILAVFTINF